MSHGLARGGCPLAVAVGVDRADTTNFGAYKGVVPSSSGKCSGALFEGTTVPGDIPNDVETSKVVKHGPSAENGLFVSWEEAFPSVLFNISLGAT